MSEHPIENVTFENKNFKTVPLPFGRYYDCVFIDCDFSDSHLTEFTFIDCVFKGCNFSNVVFEKTALRDVEFQGAKLMGVHFSKVNPFLMAIDFKDCHLNLSSFYQLNLKTIRFRNCNLQEVDFSEAGMADQVFESCDLAGALFDSTNLENADFRTAFDYSIDPELNRIKGAKFSKIGALGLLDKYDIEIEST